MRIHLLGVFLLAFSAAACSEVGERTQLSVGYYSIHGKTFDELDQQIALHGPPVTGIGRALAATNIRMAPEFTYGFRDGNCVVQSANVRVQAHVILPRLASRTRLGLGLSRGWNNLEQYVRQHEAVHVSIADAYALKAENLVLSLPPEPECETLRGNVALAFRKLMAEHEQEQIQFDEDEKQRIKLLVAKTRLGEAPDPGEPAAQ